MNFASYVPAVVRDTLADVINSGNAALNDPNQGITRRDLIVKVTGCAERLGTDWQMKSVYSSLAAHLNDAEWRYLINSILNGFGDYETFRHNMKNFQALKKNIIAKLNKVSPMIHKLNQGGMNFHLAHRLDELVKEVQDYEPWNGGYLAATSARENNVKTQYLRALNLYLKSGYEVLQTDAVMDALPTIASIALYPIDVTKADIKRTCS